jgi:O-antigen/teichoic acid export membrane protein
MSRAGRTTSGLAIGSIVSGLLAYVFFATATQGLGAETAAPLSVLWTYWAFAGAALTFPLQHWVTRHLATGATDLLRTSARRVRIAVLGFAAASGGVAWLLREPLFHRPDAWFPMLVVGVALGSALMGLVRGVAGGRQRFAAVAASLVAENALRCLLAGALLLAGIDDPVAFGLALAAGPAVAVLWWPRLPPAGDRSDAPRPADPGSAAPGAVTGLTTSGGAQVVAQTVLTGAPVLLALSGGSPSAVTSLFAALALFRAPYLVALGAVPQLTVQVARRTAGGRLPLPVRPTYAAAAALAVGLLVALAAAVGAAVGPALVRLVFGPTVEVSATTSGLLAAGCTLAVVNLVLMVVALAQDRATAALAAWGAAAVAATAAGLVLAARGPAALALGAFLSAETTALVGLAVAALRPAQRRPAQRRPAQRRGL